VDSLEFSDRLVLECARRIREDFLHQNAFHDVDTFSSLTKQHGILKTILTWFHLSQDGLNNGVSFFKLTGMEVLEQIGRMKYIKEDEFKTQYDAINLGLTEEYQRLLKGDEDDGERV